MDYPHGTAYPPWFQNNIANAPGTVTERASMYHVSRATVYRIDTRAAANHAEPMSLANPQHRTNFRGTLLGPSEAAVLAVLTFGNPQVSLTESQAFLHQGFGLNISQSTISREFRRLGFSRKQVHRVSIKRDEDQRVAWWTSPLPVGCLGLLAPDLVDIDESHFVLEKSWRRYGRSLIGEPAVVRSQVVLSN